MSEICAHFQGYRYAGLMGGDECFCGKQFTPGKVSNSCNVPCYGKTSEVCGGHSAIQVFDIGKFLANS